MTLRGGNRNIGDTGRKAESRTAKRLSGRLTPASGASIGAKGDIHTPTFLIENKSTVKESISLKLDWLRKITTEARGVDRSPALAIQFTDEAGRPLRNGRWMCIRESDYRELTEGDD
jgi:hypothetical protein